MLNDVKNALDLGCYREKIDQILIPLIRSDAPLALFDFPNYSNVGDSAIWLGQIEFLKSIDLSRLVVNDTSAAYWTPNMRLPKDAVLLINGGGNFGDLYPRHQLLRLHLCRQFPNNRIIQLPQSIHFERDENIAETSKVLNEHPDFHLLVRDKASLELAKKIHNGNSQLCPDMALYLGSIPRPCEPVHKIVALLRIDKERKLSNSTYEITSAFETDWLEEPLTPWIRWTHWVEKIHSRRGRWLKFLFHYKYHLYHRVANERLRRGCELLSSGRLVITDRLHAHILCTLMSIPHVVVDNSYRKIGNLMDAWHTDKGLCRRAENFEEAEVMAIQMLAQS